MAVYSLFDCGDCHRFYHRQDTMSILEKIFHIKELKSLREKNKKLVEQNVLILRGEAIHITQFERRMILDALIYDGYKAKIQNPKRKRFIRDIYRNLKDKIILFDSMPNKEEDLI